MAEVSKVLDKDGNIIGMKINGVIQKKPYPTVFIENVKPKEGIMVKEGTRVLQVPKMRWQKNDPINQVREHLEALHGKEGAREKLRGMSGLEVLTLADELKTKTVKTGDSTVTTAGGKEIRVLQAPKMDWSKKGK